MPVVLFLWVLLLRQDVAIKNSTVAAILLALGASAIVYKIRKRMDTNLTKNFKLSEFASKDGADTPADVLKNLRQLAKNLEVIRLNVGKPIKVNSGYRSPQHNKDVGGEDNSQHLKGKAADIVVPGYTSTQLAAVIFMLIAKGQISQGGVGIYPTFVHYDIRGKKARW